MSPDLRASPSSRSNPTGKSDALIQQLGLPPFRPRFPWWGGDLQTIRDSVVPHISPKETAHRQEIDLGAGHRLLALLDPAPTSPPQGVVLLVHGLSGDSEGPGLKRLGRMLQLHGFSVLRLNLRGAGEGRLLAPGSYSAACTRDLLPVFRYARRLAEELGEGMAPLPLHGVGLSLGGTVLLNACLDGSEGTVSEEVFQRPLDRLACISSPLDLASSAARIDAPRNLLYRMWLLRRLINQTLNDPCGTDERERGMLTTGPRRETIQWFDDAITAPRWGFGSAQEYYLKASPLVRIRGSNLPPTLLVQAIDDPWVPAGPALQLVDAGDLPLSVVICSAGGHTGFHGVGLQRRHQSGGAAADLLPRSGCWTDHLVSLWLRAPTAPEPWTPHA